MNAKKHLTVLLCLLLLCPLCIQAQTNYKPGYVVTMAGDTLHGFIDYKEWVLSPVAFSFKSAVEDKASQEFDASSARYFEVSGMEAHQRYEGPVTMNPVDLKNLSYNSNPQVANATVFLKLLQTGEHVQLLSYNDMIKIRYFIQEQDGAQPQELYYNRYYASGTGQKKLSTQRGYTGQLLHLASKYEVLSPGLKRQIESADYKDYNFIAIVKLLNRSAAAPVAASQKEAGNTRFYAGIGMSSHVATVQGKNILSDADKNSAHISPRVVVGADYFFNRHVQKLLLRLEAGAGTARYSIEKTERSGSGVTEHTYTLYQQSVSLSPQLIYNLYNTDNFKAYLGLALQFNYSKYSGNTYNSQYSNPTIPYDYAPVEKENFMSPEPLWTSFVVRSGLVVNRKFELAAAFMPPTGVTSQNNYSLNLTTYSLGVNYLFNKKLVGARSVQHINK